VRGLARAMDADERTLIGIQRRLPQSAATGPRHRAALPWGGRTAAPALGCIHRTAKLVRSVHPIEEDRMRASGKAHAQLRAEILDWTLPPGTPLGEVEQSIRLGVSRTPLREALSRLRGEGLVRADGARGAVVADLGAADVRALFELRGALEDRAVRLAARRRDPAPFERLARALDDAPRSLEDDTDPHHAAYYAVAEAVDAAIDHAAASPYLTASLAGVRTHLVRVRRVSRDDPDRLRAAAAEHLVVVRAILAQDETLAAQAVAVHLHHSLRQVLAAFAAASHDLRGRPGATSPRREHAGAPA